jgi:hypothetical protein
LIQTKVVLLVENLFLITGLSFTHPTMHQLKKIFLSDKRTSFLVFLISGLLITHPAMHYSKACVLSKLKKIFLSDKHTSFLVFLISGLPITHPAMHHSKAAICVLLVLVAVLEAKAEEQNGEFHSFAQP